MGGVKLVARIVDGRAFCGRPGCSGGPFGAVVEAGWNSGGTVYSLDPGIRWLWRLDLIPPRWHRGRHTRAVDRHESQDPRSAILRRLPTVVECPDCKAIQVVQATAMG